MAGFDLVLGILVLTAFGADSTAAGAAAASIAAFATWPLAAVGLVTLATGVLLGSAEVRARARTGGCS